MATGAMVGRLIHDTERISLERDGNSTGNTA